MPFLGPHHCVIGHKIICLEVIIIFFLVQTNYYLNEVIFLFALALTIVFVLQSNISVSLMALHCVFAGIYWSSELDRIRRQFYTCFSLQ